MKKIKAVVFVVAALFLATAVVNAGVPDDYPVDGYPVDGYPTDNGAGEGDEEDWWDARVSFTFRFTHSQGPTAEISNFICPDEHPEDEYFRIQIEFDNLIGTDPQIDYKFSVYWDGKIDNTAPGDQLKKWPYSHESWCHDFNGDGDTDDPGEYQEGLDDNDEYEANYIIGDTGQYTFWAECSMVFYLYEWDYDLDKWEEIYSDRRYDYKKKDIWYEYEYA